MASGRDTILIVTQSELFAQSLEKYLGESGYAVAIANDLTSGVAEAHRNAPCLVLVDRNVAGGFNQFLRNPLLRKVPIVTMQQPGVDCAEDVCIEDIDQGGDSVLCNQSYREMIAHVRAILRRQQLKSGSRALYVVDRLRMDIDRHEVIVDGRAVELTPKEFQILYQLVQDPSRVFSRDELLNRVWGEGCALEEHTLDVHIHSLRHKIEADPAHPRFIVTVRGIGYKLKSE